MKFVAESGAWTSGPPVADVPAVAVLEINGAVLAWTVDDPGGVAATRLTVTDVAAADWLWRVVGPGAHTSVVDALRACPERGVLDLPEATLQPESLLPLRRLAVGHWLRRWWPESSRDGIVPLDRALLDCELAVLTSSAQDFFTDDTFDSDVEGLLAPHREALGALERAGDPRIVAMVRAGALLAEDLGVWSLEVAHFGSASVVGRRADYALAAGRELGGASGAVADGDGSVNWIAVPPGIFDAADQTIEWSIEADDGGAAAVVRVATTGRVPATDIAVRIRSGDVTGIGVLDADGGAALALVGPTGIALTGTQCWDHDWSTATVVIGPGPGAEDSPVAQAVRQRLRDFARERLARPAADAFLAEIVAAESDY